MKITKKIGRNMFRYLEDLSQVNLTHLPLYKDAELCLRNLCASFTHDRNRDHFSAEAFVSRRQTVLAALASPGRRLSALRIKSGGRESPTKSQKPDQFLENMNKKETVMEKKSESEWTVWKIFSRWNRAPAALVSPGRRLSALRIKSGGRERPTKSQKPNQCLEANKQKRNRFLEKKVRKWMDILGDVC